MEVLNPWEWKIPMEPRTTWLPPTVEVKVSLSTAHPCELARPGLPQAKVASLHGFILCNGLGSTHNCCVTISQFWGTDPWRM